MRSHPRVSDRVITIDRPGIGTSERHGASIFSTGRMMSPNLLIIAVPAITSPKSSPPSADEQELVGFGDLAEAAGGIGVAAAGY